MKKRIIFIGIILMSLTLTQVATGQPPHPPAIGHGSTSNLPQGAPVGDGLILLIGMAGLFGSKKYYEAKKGDKNEE